MKLKSMGLGWHPFFMKWKIKHVWNHQPEFKSTSILHFFLVDILRCEAKSFLTGFNMFHLFLRTLWISQLGTWSNRLGIQNSWNHQVSAEVLRGEKKTHLHRLLKRPKEIFSRTSSVTLSAKRWIRLSLRVVTATIATAAAEPGAGWMESCFHWFPVLEIVWSCLILNKTMKNEDLEDTK